MPLWSREVSAAKREEAPRPDEAATVGATDVGAPVPNPFGMMAQAWWDSYVVRDQAMTVPAFRRATQLVAASISNLKLQQIGPDGKAVIPVPFLRQPDSKSTTQSLLARTVEDLCLWGTAYWLNPNWNSPAGWRFADTVKKHREIIRIPPEDVAKVTHHGFTVYKYDDQGIPHPYEVPVEAVIMFEAPAGHWLRDGARTIQTAQLLEDAVRNYAKTPLPSAIIRNQGARKTPQQVQEILATYEAARSTRSTGYVGRDLDITTLGWSAQDIALSEARAQVVLDISRLTGVPPLYLAQGIQNSSHQYANLTQQRIDLHAAIQPFATAIEQRLSFDDVLGAGYTAQFDFTPFLRVDPMMRADWYVKLIGAGVMTPEQAAAFEQLEPTPDAPTSVDPHGGIEGPNRTGTTGQ